MIFTKSAGRTARGGRATGRLDFTNAIEVAGIECKAAERHAATIFDAIRENMATKTG